MRTIEDYRFRDMVLRIGKKAVKDAQSRSLANGIPNVYNKNGTIYFEMPDGEITSKVPEMYQDNYLEKKIKL